MTETVRYEKDGNGRTRRVMPADAAAPGREAQAADAAAPEETEKTGRQRREKGDRP